MVDIKALRENPEEFRNALIKRQMPTDLLEEILNLDEERRRLITETNQLRAKRNELSREVAKLKKSDTDASTLIEESKQIGERIKAIENRLSEIDGRVNYLLLSFPNPPHESVPVGKDETENVVIRQWGEPRRFSFEPRAHWDLGPQLGMLDFDRAAKLSGSRFVILRKELAQLERALINFMLDLHTREHGYVEIMPPHLVSRESITATGQLPKFEEELYNTQPDDLFLIPTAEVSLVGMHRNEILFEADLPLKYVAYTPCYRREAGSYGKDVRGMVRVHQFNKVELVWFAHPEKSYEALEELTSHAEEVLKRLKLPYRVVELCTGDLGFAAAKTYDIEVWLPSYNDYKEISSCSNTEDFQARRGNIRYRARDNSLRHPHTLNGSGLAVGRTLIAIMENYQTEDGKIEIPDVLRPYMNGLEVIG
ncbi:MAG: seryl-tRNA synthetase [Thermotogota bacterium]|nr:seryl-tRNA synthetase [Thermotogota bacterium]HCZ07277.1 serine--tRNA ligase [Thermotogota bacterium]